MYKWNKRLLNMQIDYLKDIIDNNDFVEETIKSLKALKHNAVSGSISTISQDKDDYNIFPDKVLLKGIMSKYKYDDISITNYIKIRHSSEDLIIFIQDIIKGISKNWYNKLEYLLNDNNYINISKKGSNYMYYVEYLDKYFISLSKNDDITDFTNAIHEFMHIYSTMLNKKLYDNTESELLSIFGEFIILEEIKKRCMFGDEPYKAEINDYKYILSYINSIIVREKLLKSDMQNINKFLGKDYNYSKRDLKVLYQNNINYLFSTVICYFIAIELIDIYKQDKEKACYIIEDVVKSEGIPLEYKLKKHNIETLSNSDQYIKSLKKEYTIYNQ